ncbi:unnamed protein product [Strongylus vulgaris]|uniref:Uncharacterized protein n=1 Tax=Strongylus vulgaris TaxID=40348 RepID=A0A3P7LJP8_STRVU|nr:unnamed protein product [Strongylus vulgaris]
MFWFGVIAACCICSVVFANMIMREFNEHGFSTRIKLYPVKQLKFPTLVFCPRYADAFHVDTILEVKMCDLTVPDMRMRLGDVDEKVAFDILRFLIAGSGLDNVQIKKWDEEYRCFMDV